MITRAALVAFAAATLALAGAEPSLAADSADEQAITYPALVAVEAAAGTATRAEVLVQNQTRSDVRFTTRVLDVEPGRGGVYDYVPIGSADRGAGAWVDAVEPEAFRIAAGEQRTIVVSIDVPAGTRPGGHAAALVFVAQDPDPNAQFRVDLRSPVPILVTVDGDAERAFDASVDAGERIRLSGGRVRWRVELRNDGELHEVVRGELRVDGVLGADVRVPIRPGVLLPGERRVQTIVTNLREAPDLVRADVRVERAEGDAVDASSPRLLMLPWWVLVVLVAALAILEWRRRARRSWRDEEP